MAQYYTLDEAAKKLQTTPTKLKEMAKKGEVRAFQDRGNLRFRGPEIDELARAKGFGSDPELQLGESIPLTEGPVTPRAGPKSPPPDDAGEVFEFTLSADDGSKVPLGETPPPSAKSDPPSSSSRKKNAPRPSTLKAPPPMISSDSDVRLIADGSDLDFKIAEEPRAARSPSPSRQSSTPSRLKGPSPSKLPSSKSKLAPPSKKDSEVRIVPPEKASDSDIQLVGEDPEDSSLPLGQSRAKRPSDSDIRMDHADLPPAGSSGRRRNEVITEEIDLDAEFAKAQQAARAKGGSPTSSKLGKNPKLPTSSPFELSEADLHLEKPRKTPPPSKKAQPEDDESSEEFSLEPMPRKDSGTESSPLEASSDEVPLLMGDDEVSLGELTGAGGGSGINLQLPADSGISLEQGGSDEIEFELSLDPSDESKSLIPKERGKTTLGKSQPAPEVQESEFELSLNDENAEAAPDSGSDSEFELTLDGEESVEVALEKPSDSDSDSEFELTLDEGGGPEDVDESGGLGGDEEKDIFETDFEVPALDEESASEAMALESDTDVETSDFDLNASDSSEDGSQVVELEDDEADAGAATVKRPSRGAKAAIADEAEVEEDAEELLDEDDDDRPVRRVAVDAPPAEWGAMPALVLLPCVLVLFVVGLMGFELVQGMWGYHRGSKVPGLIVDPIARMFDFNETLPKND